MHAVHIRGYQQAAYPAIDAARQPYVGVIEKRHAVQQNFEYQHCEQCRTEQRDYSPLDQHRDHYLDGVKS